MRNTARTGMRTLPRRSFLLLVFVAAATISRPVYLAAGKPSSSQKQFYLIGVGPGDPDLITLRAIRAIEKADVIFPSPGVVQRFEEYLRGKQVIEGYWHLFPFYGVRAEDVAPSERERYERITAKRNEFIRKVRQAVAQGKVVAIVDSGDPLIYGPWSWTLQEFADLDPVVVPGLSCFNAANAALRCSPTSGKTTKSVILTAEDWPGKTDTIERLSKLRTTMVLFTMTAHFEHFIQKLQVHWPPETPIAVVEHAGFAEKERVITGTLGTILSRVRSQQLPFEYLIYVGDFLQTRSNPDG
ncbi:MAG: tetrapyrrole methylase [Planctomycetes bacterium]|nr:tetrapyrrole methylase [Planctomycetota bacterium]